MSINQFLFILVAVSLCGCATITKIPTDRDALETAVRQNDTDTARSLLKDKSFVGSSMFPNDHDKYYNELEAYQLLELAITGKVGNNFGQFKGFDPAPQGVCRPGVVQAILDAKLAPRPVDLSNAAGVPCADVMEVILGKMSDKDATAGTSMFLQSFKFDITNGNINPADKREAWNRVLAVLKKRGGDSTKADLDQARGWVDNPASLGVVTQPQKKTEWEKAAEIDARGTFFKKGFCYPTFSLQYTVNQKIDKNHYGAVTDMSYPESIHLNRHAIIEMNNFNPNLRGYVNTLVEYIGTKKIALDNGFDSNADLLRQCKRVFKCTEDGVFNERGTHMCSTKNMP